MWMNSCRAAVLGSAMLIGAAVSRAAPVANDEVAQAIKRMGSDDAQERADAAAGLRAAGADAFPIRALKLRFAVGGCLVAIHQDGE